MDGHNRLAFDLDDLNDRLRLLHFDADITADGKEDQANDRDVDFSRDLTDEELRFEKADKEDQHCSEYCGDKDLLIERDIFSGFQLDSQVSNAGEDTNRLVREECFACRSAGQHSGEGNTCCLSSFCVEGRIADIEGFMGLQGESV